MVVTSSEEDSPSFVPDEALGDASVVRRATRPRQRRRIGRRLLLQHCVAVQDLDGEVMAASPGLQLIHLDEHRLPHWRLHGPAGGGGGRSEAIVTSGSHGLQ